MTREEILNRMEEIENDRFLLAMKDYWNNRDYETDQKWLDEYHALTRELELLPEGA